MFILSYSGELAALCTAVVWSASAICTTSASRLTGPLFFNKYRLLMWTAVIFFINAAVTGQLLPVADGKQWWILTLSGLFGLTIGDIFLYQAYLDIGPRLALLISNIGPFFTAIIAGVLLGEKMSLGILLGMFVTIGGTAWVLLEENGKGEKRHPKLVRGVFFVIFQSLSQAAGFVLAKPALIGNSPVHPISATLIRLLAGTAIFWFIAQFLGGRMKKEASRGEKKTSMVYIFIGSFLGPIGIWTSLIALKTISAGVAATLIATLPVMILPWTILVYKEKVSFRAFFGAVITVLGVAMLFYFK